MANPTRPERQDMRAEPWTEPGSGPVTGQLTLRTLAVFSVLVAVVTILPLPVAYASNLWGAQTVCPFAPGSTAACLVVAIVLWRKARR